MIDDGGILRILQEAARAAVAASTIPTLPIKYLGRTFKPTDQAPDGKYLELVFLPNNRNSDFWGDEKNFRGTFRLILHWPNDDKGAYAPLAALKSIAGYFSKGTLLQNVQIYETPDLTGPLEGASETLYPASIRYTSYRG